MKLKIITLCILVISCGQSGLEQFAAPTSPSQVGLIAACTNYQQASESGFKFRVLANSIIEFIGVSKQEILQKMPHARVVANELFYSESTSETQSSTLNFPHLNQISHSDLASGAGVLVAVVDTGVDMSHQDLIANIHRNDLEVIDGLDNDGNGYVDDVHGFDFYSFDNDATDDNGHGTHVAGLIAGKKGGVAKAAKILPVKVLSSSGQGDLGTIAKGIFYAISQGAQIINLSLGGPVANKTSAVVQQLISSVKESSEKNVLIVAAAGNGGQDGIGDCNDANDIYPANIEYENIISVAAVDAYDQLTSYSNFGAQTVDISAPGGDQYTGALLSTAAAFCRSCTSNAYTYMSGTSMAAPVVAGLAAQVLGSKSLTHVQLKQLLMNTVDKTNELKEVTVSGGVINAFKAINALK